jgi:hypothetical protein
MLAYCKQRTKPIAGRELLKARFLDRHMTGNPNRLHCRIRTYRNAHKRKHFTLSNRNKLPLFAPPEETSGSRTTGFTLLTLFIARALPVQRTCLD